MARHDFSPIVNDPRLILIENNIIAKTKGNFVTMCYDSSCVLKKANKNECVAKA